MVFLESSKVIPFEVSQKLLGKDIDENLKKFINIENYPTLDVSTIETPLPKSRSSEKTKSSLRLSFKKHFDSSKNGAARLQTLFSLDDIAHIQRNSEELPSGEVQDQVESAQSRTGSLLQHEAVQEFLESLMDKSAENEQVFSEPGVKEGRSFSSRPLGPSPSRGPAFRPSEARVVMAGHHFVKAIKTVQEAKRQALEARNRFLEVLMEVEDGDIDEEE